VFSPPYQAVHLEDEEALKQEFPRAPAWGQAVAKGRRDVTDTISSTKVHSNTPEDPDDIDADAEHSKRTRKPNSRVYGPDWM